MEHLTFTAMQTKHNLCMFSSMAHACLLAHLRCNDSIDSCVFCILHQLMSITSSCAHHKWDLVMAVEFSIPCMFDMRLSFCALLVSDTSLPSTLTVDSCRQSEIYYDHARKFLLGFFHSLLSLLWSDQLNRYALNPNIPYCYCFAAASETERNKRESSSDPSFCSGVTHLACASVDHDMLSIGRHRCGRSPSVRCCMS